MELLVDAAADKVKLVVREATYLKTFMVTGFEAKTCGMITIKFNDNDFSRLYWAKLNGFSSKIHSILGSLNSNYGGWIGIPINYLYDSVRDIDRFNIKIKNEPISWNSKHGELLEKSLVLTEDEKLFGFIRSILELRNYNHVHSTVVPGITIMGLYASAQEINRRYSLFNLPSAVSEEEFFSIRIFDKFSCIFCPILGTRSRLLFFDGVCVRNLYICYGHHSNPADGPCWQSHGRIGNR